MRFTPALILFLFALISIIAAACEASRTTPVSTPTFSPAPASTSTATPPPTITPIPRVLSSVSIEPEQATTRPGDKFDFTARALDQFGEELLEASTAWFITTGGAVSQQGVFTAGTRAGKFPGAVQIVAQAGGVTLHVAASLTIEPGPVDHASIEPSRPTRFTGDPIKFKASAFDKHENAIPDIRVEWLSDAGQFDRTGTFSAGREPGAFQIMAVLSDGEASLEASETMTVEQGYCEQRTSVASWEFELYELNDDLTFGNFLKRDEAAGNFDFDWGQGSVFGTREDRVGLKATTTVAVQRQGPVLFTVGGDDGFRLYLDGTEIISDWQPHSYRKQSKMVMLNPGFYDLKLEYYERTAFARLTFTADSDVLQWQEATECFGGFVKPPDGRYFEYPATGESVDDIAVRFGIDRHEISALNPDIGDSLLLPGITTSGPKVIIIQA